MCFNLIYSQQDIAFFQVTAYLEAEQPDVMGDILVSPPLIKHLLKHAYAHQRQRQQRSIILDFDKYTSQKFPASIAYRIDSDIYTGNSTCTYCKHKYVTHN